MTEQEQTIERKEELKPRACIDTMALRIGNENMNDVGMLKEVNKNYLSDWNKAINYTRTKVNAEDSYVVVKLHNLYREKSGKEHYVTSYKQHKELYKMLMNEIGVINLKEVDIVRRDICIDFDFDFTTNFKKSLYLFDLLTIDNSMNKRWYTVSMDTLNTNSIKLDTSKFQISFYDKEEESKGKASHKTRYEFRYKGRKGNDIDKSINDLIKKIEELPSKVEKVNERMIERLKKQYDNKKAKRPKMTFSSFVDEYDKYIYNTEILKELYKYAGLKGSFKKWVMHFREVRNEDFILLSNREVISRFGITEDIKRALKEYKRK